MKRFPLTEEFSLFPFCHTINLQKAPLERRTYIYVKQLGNGKMNQMNMNKCLTHTHMTTHWKLICDKTKQRIINDIAIDRFQTKRFNWMICWCFSLNLEMIHIQFHQIISSYLTPRKLCVETKIFITCTD